MISNSARIVFTGDMVLGKGDSKYKFENVAPYLRKSDVVIGQMEGVITKTPPKKFVAFRSSPESVIGVKDAGYDAVTVAHHAMEPCGVEGLLDTLETFRSNGIPVVGAGENLAKANEHVIVEKKGFKVAVVMRNCLITKYNTATEDTPGLAPLRVHTFYESLENLQEQPATPARTISIANHRDLAELKKEVGRAKAKADFVATCFHWGVHQCHDLAMYQPEVAYAMIEAGADIVVGNHPHVVQAVDVFKGKPIFYSQGNFAFTALRGKGERGMQDMQDFPYRNPIPEKKAHHQSIVAECEVTKGGIQTASFLASSSDDERIPTILDANQGDYRKIVDLIARLSKISGATFHPVGNKLTLNLKETEEIDVRELLWDRLQSYPSLAWIE